VSRQLADHAQHTDEHRHAQCHAQGQFLIHTAGCPTERSGYARSLVCVQGHPPSLRNQPKPGQTQTQRQARQSTLHGAIDQPEREGQGEEEVQPGQGPRRDASICPRRVYERSQQQPARSITEQVNHVAARIPDA
jgi:hypothetical protein